MAQLVKLLTYDDGDEKTDLKWCLVEELSDSPRTACTGEAFGPGESGCEFKTKQGLIKDITCPRCKEIIKWYKGLK